MPINERMMLYPIQIEVTPEIVSASDVSYSSPSKNGRSLYPRQRLMFYAHPVCVHDNQGTFYNQRDSETL